MVQVNVTKHCVVRYYCVVRLKQRTGKPPMTEVTIRLLSVSTLTVLTARLRDKLIFVVALNLTHASEPSTTLVGLLSLNTACFQYLRAFCFTLQCFFSLLLNVSES